jgi:hypothetical protein
VTATPSPQMLLVRELIEHSRVSPTASIEQRRAWYDRAETAFGPDSVPAGERGRAGGLRG